MSTYSSRIAIPSPGSMNGGLHSPTNTQMLALLGVPSSSKSQNCSSPTNPKLKRLIETRDVGPFRATGLKYALDSLERIFKAAAAKDANLVAQCKTAGMLCCRLQRGSSRLWSNHSFGTAIDLYYGAGVVPRGDAETHQGVLDLYPYFHNEGWYWGAEFGVPDAMHYEVSSEMLRDWDARGWI